MEIQSLKGMNDILPDETAKWEFVESKAREVFKSYGFNEIRTPIVEHAELFNRAVGLSSEIVLKQMYVFRDRGERLLALRPEETAGVVRAYIEHKMQQENRTVKLFYIGQMFRAERPQAGRYRQFHQIGVEMFGAKSALADSELIAMNAEFFRAVGLSDFELHINTVGCPLCRKDYRKVIEEYFAPFSSEICEDCKERLAHNPLRIMDCKNDRCVDISSNTSPIYPHLCAECSAHFSQLKEILDVRGINYELNPKLVRGLDYYTKTVFEFVKKDIGAQSAVSGGGRYDLLVEEFEGPPTPASGFAIGVERLISAVEFKETKRRSVFIVWLGEKAKIEGIKLAEKLRRENVTVEMDYEDKSLKAQLKSADKAKSTHAIIIGENEISRGIVILKDMQTGEQKELSPDGIIANLS